MADVKMEVPSQIRELAAASVDQAEKAFLNVVEAMKHSTTGMPNAGAEFSSKTLTLAEKNMKAAFDHARKLVHAKDLSEAMQLQTDFIQRQIVSAREQLNEIRSVLPPAGSHAGKDFSSD